MIADIQDEKYQVGFSSNKEADKAIKKFMEDKYNWLGWVRFLYIFLSTVF